MKIHDKKNNLLSIVIKKDDIVSGKNFETKNDQEFQLASFGLDSGTKIEKHYHPNQKREIVSTSEVLVLIEGSMLVDIYDTELNFVTNVELFSGDTIALLDGGHGITFLENSKFIEVKQGPFNPETDKKRF